MLRTYLSFLIECRSVLYIALDYLQSIITAQYST
jgi:hypothetical protein